MIPLAQLPPPSFWAQTPDTPGLWMSILIGLLVGMVLFFAIMYAPAQARRHIVAAFTFVAGLFWVLVYAFPAPIDLQKTEVPQGPVEGVGKWLRDSSGIVANFTAILTGFLLGLGIFSLLTVHLRRIRRRQTDWGFSVILIFSLVLMVFFGYWDFFTRQGPDAARLDDQANWGIANYGRDFLFEGLLQQMDAAMFSIIAFYILSAAYRAFRIRSVEATILLATALIVMLSLMGAVTYVWNGAVTRAANGNPFLLNFQLTEIARWINSTFQTPALRGIGFGVGIGALAMGLRIWLSLERSGGNS